MTPMHTDHTMKACPKCGGTGRLHAYAHIDGGKCFKCNGTGEVSGEKITRDKTVAEMIEDIRLAGIELAHIEEDNDDDWERIFDNSHEAEFIAGVKLLHAAL